MPDFLADLKIEIRSHLKNYYRDNYDHTVKPLTIGFKKRTINFLKKIVFTEYALGVFLHSDLFYKNFFLGKLFKLQPYFDDLQFMYTHLDDDQSGQLFLNLMAYRVLGYV